MTFYCQIALCETGVEDFRNSKHVAMFFKCDNSPGLCEDGELGSGDNAAPLSEEMLTSTEIRSLSSLNVNHQLPELYIQLMDFSEPSSPDLLLKNYWQNGKEIEERGFLFGGKLGGSPVWIGVEHFPLCKCGESLLFLGQLEENEIGTPGMNFGGGGRAYFFFCAACASVLWMWDCH